MVPDITAIQSVLREDAVDGWLLYDFHGSNQIARRIVGIDTTEKLTTRRWYYFIPATGQPCALVHAIEGESLVHLPGNQLKYAGRQELKDGLKSLVDGCKRIVMEYSPNCDIPYVSRVDAGTIDAIRSHGVEIISSGNLVQRFESIWNKKSLDAHLLASERLYKIKDQAFAMIRGSIANKKTVSEFEIQQTMVGWFAEEGLISDSPPVVASQENSGNPHYLPTKTNTRLIRQNEIVLLDLWGKLDTPEAVFADITWVGYTASSVPSNIASVFRVVLDARDAAIDLVVNSTRSGRVLEGWEVDRVARTVVEEAGHGKRFVHRTGHSLGKDVHGNGVHMDDYETHDDRRLLTGTGFTIEPGIYFENFGVRTEVNMYVGSEEALVTGPLQKDLVKLVS